MHWFRSKQTGLTWLAFFALAGQLTLSFGHLHLGKFGLGLSSGAGNGVATVFVSAPQQGIAGGVDDVCAICASISLASKLVAPNSPAFVPPTPNPSKLPQSLAASAPASFDHFLFDARGPPQA
jgi:hypothetical protein